MGVPAEYFTSLGVDIKQRSPIKDTFVAELANDWIGYLPDREGHQLGGYQTWMGITAMPSPAPANGSRMKWSPCCASSRRRKSNDARHDEDVSHLSRCAGRELL